MVSFQPALHPQRVPLSGGLTGAAGQEGPAGSYATSGSRATSSSGGAARERQVGVGVLLEPFTKQRWETLSPGRIRRLFYRATVLATGAGLRRGRLGLMLVIAHVSDTHFGDDLGAAGGRAAAVMDHLLAMEPRPDVLVVTGDVADHGLPHEYDEARAWLDRWAGPREVCLGNHDVRAAFAAGLGVDPNAVLEVGGVRFVMLDSLVDAVDGRRVDEGSLGHDQLAWLEEQLAADGRPTYVCLHHPPLTINLELMDPFRLLDGEALAAVLTRHPHVVATLVGHAHTMGVTSFAGRPLLIGGGVVSAVTADSERLPQLWYGAPPSFALHLVDDDGRVTTHWRALPQS